MSADVSSSPSNADHSQDELYPPFPQSGPAEDSDLAQQNFTERERLSKSWRARLFSLHKNDVTLLERRIHILSSDSDSDSDSESIQSSVSVDSKQLTPDAVAEPSGVAATAAVPLASTSQDLQSFASESRTIPSQDTSRILVRDSGEEDPTKDQHLYRWAMVYENQRGISLFSTRRYSSQSLLPRDPPSFSIAAPSPSLIDGRQVRKSSQPNFTLEDFPLPDGNWRWASKEWLIDMRDETVQYDGFEYNWFFRSRGWRSKAGRLNAGAWVRRRRWLRLMERPPLSALQQSEDTGNSPREPKTSFSLDLGEVWRGDDKDWSRLHRVMLGLGRDGRRLEVWKEWISITQADGNDETTNSISAVLRAHMSDFLTCFVFPSSRIEFLELVTTSHLLSEGEVLNMNFCELPFVERSQIKDRLLQES